MAQNHYGAKIGNSKKKRKNRKSSNLNSFVASEDDKSLNEESSEDITGACDNEDEVDVEFNVVLIGKCSLKSNSGGVSYC